MRDAGDAEEVSRFVHRICARQCPANGYYCSVSRPLAAGEFRPGFRCSVTDVAIVALGVVAGFEIAQLGLWIALAIGHFFLFCNVLRLARPLELAWATLFVAGAGAVRGGVALTPVLVAIGATTLVIAVIAIGRPSYHGVLWRRLNPELPQWWHARGK
jgi:hypothetical protein